MNTQSFYALDRVGIFPCLDLYLMERNVTLGKPRDVYYIEWPCAMRECAGKCRTQNLRVHTGGRKTPNDLQRAYHFIGRCHLHTSIVQESLCAQLRACVADSLGVRPFDIPIIHTTCGHKQLVTGLDLAVISENGRKYHFCAFARSVPGEKMSTESLALFNAKTRTQLSAFSVA